MEDVSSEDGLKVRLVKLTTLLENIICAFHSLMQVGDFTDEPEIVVPHRKKRSTLEVHEEVSREVGFKVRLGETHERVIFFQRRAKG